MIYITGDTHGDFTRFSAKRLRRTGMELTKEDYIIICGDFGLCWAKDKTFEYHCKNFAEKPYTILWVQGNHENYDMIGEYPLEEWHGGKARHIIRDKVILLERGQVFEIEGKSFLPLEGHLPMTFREEFWIVRRWISQNRSAGQTGIIFPTGSFRKAGGPRSCRQRENCRRACAIWNDITTR